MLMCSMHRGSADETGHEGCKPRSLWTREAQAELAPPPQHVVLGLRPFILDEVTQLRRREISAHQRAEISERARLRQNAARPRPIGADQSPRVCFAQKRPARAGL